MNSYHSKDQRTMNYPFFQPPVFERIVPNEQTLKRKFYDLNTCYDGQRDFSIPAENGRYYPDEDVIISQINAYRQQKPELQDLPLTLCTETMHWKSNGELVRSLDIESVIYRALHHAVQQPQLIVVVFHYHYHHMFLALNTERREGVYHDPMGNTPETCLANGQAQYANLVEILKRLEVISGYHIERLANKQQIDGVSCGPLVSQSIAELLDYYYQHKTLQGMTYPSPRKKLATLKLRLMNLQNSHLGETGDLVREEMLASAQLYEAFLQEQHVPQSTIKLWLDHLKQAGIFEEEQHHPINILKSQNRLNFQQNFFDLVVSRENNKLSAYIFEALTVGIESQQSNNLVCAK